MKLCTSSAEKIRARLAWRVSLPSPSEVLLLLVRFVACPPNPQNARAKSGRRGRAKSADLRHMCASLEVEDMRGFAKNVFLNEARANYADAAFSFMLCQTFVDIAEFLGRLPSTFL